MNAGTILYIPVAQAEGGATVTVKGQLYGPTLKLDGTDITTGTANHRNRQHALRAVLR